MRLPPDLQDAIDRETAKVERRKLAHVVAQLSDHYKAADFSTAAVTSSAHRAAYLAVRMPATYAVVRRVLSEITQHAEIKSLLDIGSGPGTVLFAAAEDFSLEQSTLIEVDPEWITLAQSLAQQSGIAATQKAHWTKQDIRSGLSCSPHDLVIISYTIGELSKAAAEMVLRKAWNCASKFLVIIEPGTPRGFAAIDSARSLLMASSAKIIAPCPHQSACPMAAAGDWCHFSQRVERTSLHRQLKGGTLGYEDEKFSYLIAARPEVNAGTESPAYSRIVRHPGKHSGHIKLSLCTPQGQIEERTVTRSNKSGYKAARRAEWGDRWTNCK